MFKMTSNKHTETYRRCKVLKTNLLNAITILTDTHIWIIHKQTEAVKNSHTSKDTHYPPDINGAD